MVFLFLSLAFAFSGEAVRTGSPGTLSSLPETRREPQQHAVAEGEVPREQPNLDASFFGSGDPPGVAQGKPAVKPTPLKRTTTHRPSRHDALPSVPNTAIPFGSFGIPVPVPQTQRRKTVPAKKKGFSHFVDNLERHGWGYTTLAVVNSKLGEWRTTPIEQLKTRENVPRFLKDLLKAEYSGEMCMVE